MNARLPLDMVLLHRQLNARLPLDGLLHRQLNAGLPLDVGPLDGLLHRLCWTWACCIGS